MNEKLNPYDPTPEILMGVRHQLLRAGISEEDIPKDWLRAIIAATEKWLRTTDEGVNHLSNILGFNYTYGESDKEYALVDTVHNTSHTLKNSQVVFYEGVLVNGNPVPVIDFFSRNPIPAYGLEISERTKNKCDSCGIVSHCLKEILEPYSEKLESLCNFCLSHHDHAKISGEGSLTICSDCSVHKCPHHPTRQK